jgi:hypothetical protein
VVHDADADSVCDPLDNCPATPNVGQQNADGDARGDACDCNSSNASIWSVPSDVTALVLQGKSPTSLSWTASADPGGSQQVLYDVLRSGSASRFLETEPTAVCVATGLTSPAASDPSPSPSPGAGYFYLVRASNGCGGTLGTGSSGVPRAGRACP